MILSIWFVEQFVLFNKFCLLVIVLFDVLLQT